MTPFLSIIIPVYNACKYLQETLPALKKELSLEMEVILVDDGSTDESGKICSRFAEESANIRFISQLNAGPNAARSHGIRESAGKYITFLDADDQYQSGTLRSACEYLHQTPADLLMIPVKKVHSDNTESINIEINSLQKITGDELRSLWSLGDKRIAGYLCAKFYDRMTLDGISLPEDMRFAEDMYALSDIFQNVRTAVFVPFGTYLYIERANTPTNGEWTDTKSIQLQKAYLHRWEVTKKNHQSLRDQISSWGQALTLHCAELKLFRQADFSFIRQELLHNRYSVCDILLSRCCLRIKYSCVKNLLEII